MAARLIYPDSRKSPVAAAVALMLVITAMLLAGCMERSGDANTTGTSVTLISVTSPVSTPRQDQTPQADTTRHLIRIDPIGRISPGDNVSFTAKTNLPVGDKIRFWICSSTFYPGGRMPNPDNLTGILYVTGGEGEMNETLFLADLTLLKPDEYIVGEDSYAYGETGTALFTLLPGPGYTDTKALKSKNFIDWEKLDLPPLVVNESMQPGVPDFNIQLVANRSDPRQIPFGTIIVFSADGLVRFFDKDGIQTAAYYDYSSLHSVGVPSGSLIKGGNGGNVTTIMYNGERILTEIFEAGE